MPLSGKQKNFLRAAAHKLKPIVTIGNAGLTDAVINEIDLSLAHHELMKIKINMGDKEQRKTMINEISDRAPCEFVQMIGRIAVIYRPADDPKYNLPK